MTHSAHVETLGGNPVEIAVTPDTPANWGRLSPAALTAVDRLADTLATLDPDWQIDIAIGWSAATTIHLTATPAPEPKDAAA